MHWFLFVDGQSYAIDLFDWVLGWVCDWVGENGGDSMEADWIGDWEAVGRNDEIDGDDGGKGDVEVEEGRGAGGWQVNIPLVVGADADVDCGVDCMNGAMIVFSKLLLSIRDDFNFNRFSIKISLQQTKRCPKRVVQSKKAF